MKTQRLPPEGLNLSQTVSAEAARDQATLPAFGTFCSRTARWFGLDSMALASVGQKLWLATAKNTLGAMAEGGAPMGNYRFIARDERRMLALMDAACSLFGNLPLTFSDNMLTNTEWRRTYADGGRSRSFTATSLYDKNFCTTFAQFALFFNDPAHVRTLGIGHEFGHAWQSAMERPMQRIIVEGYTGPLAEALRSLSERFARWTPPSHSSVKQELGADIYFRIEESVCDAIGCWAVQKAHGVNVLRPIQLFRNATLPTPESRYDTSWLLHRLEMHHPMGLPDRFDLMVAAIEIGVRQGAAQIMNNRNQKSSYPMQL